MSLRSHHTNVAFIAILLIAFSMTFDNSVMGFGPQSTDKEQQNESDVDQMFDPDPLWKAAREGDLDAVKLAIEEGVEVDAKTEYGATALFFACDRGHEAIVKFLLEKGADPNSKDTFYKATPMTWAQMKTNNSIVVMLLENGGEGAGGIFLGAINEGKVEFAKSILETGVVEKEDLIKARDAAARNEDLKNKDDIVALFETLNLPAPVEAIKLSPEALQKYAGKFKAENFTVSIEATETDLKLGFGENEKKSLTQLSETKFQLGTTDIEFVFEDEKVKTLEMSFGSNKMELVPIKSSDADSTTAEKKNAKSESKPDKATEMAAGETKKEAKFGPSSLESRQADLAISSANWPGFRGNGARGIADGQNPPTKWHVAASILESEKSETAEADSENNQGEKETVRANENLKWKTEVPGLGLSCPTVWEDRVYLTSAVPESKSDEDNLKIGLYGDVASVEDDRTYEFKLFCYSKSDGKLIWEKTSTTGKPAVKRHAKSSHANSTVATDGEHVVAFFGTEGLYCYSNSGEMVWKKDFGLLDSGWFYDPGYQWGFGSSPIVHDGKVIVQCDIQGQSFVVAMELATGEEIWRTEREEIPSWSTPTIHQFDDVAMLITCGTKAARGYDLSDGSLLWSLKGHSEIVVPTPFVAHGMIYIASGYSPIQPIYAIHPSARGDISLAKESTTSESVAWSVKRGGPYMPTPIVYGDYLYSCANNGILTCYVAKTGEQVYKKRIRVPGGALAFSASPLAADGHLYLSSEDGRVVIVKAGSQFEVVQTNELGESVLATPAISAGVIYFRAQNSLIAVGE